MAKHLKKLDLFRVLRDHGPRYFTVDDAVELWKEHGNTEKEPSRHTTQMALSRLIEGRILLRPMRGVYEVKR